MNARIEFTCQPMSFTGEELKALYPDFGTEYDTVVGFRWVPSANGPESWTLIVTLSAPLIIVGSQFLKRLADDLYDWCKDRLVTMVAKRMNNLGYVEIRSPDVSVSLYSGPPNQDVISFFGRMPELLQMVDSEICKEWHVDVLEDGELSLEPFRENISSMLHQRLGRNPTSEEIENVASNWRTEVKLRGATCEE